MKLHMKRCKDCNIKISPKSIRCKSCSNRNRLSIPTSTLTKRKISNTLKVYYKTHLGTFKGKHHSKKVRRKISKAHIGKKQSNLTIKKRVSKVKGQHRVKIGTRIRYLGYIKIYLPDNLMADKSSYVYEHRLVMAKFIGRNITSTEKIHHINGKKDDNRIKNLALFKNRSEHSKFRHYGANVGLVICPYCYKQIKLGELKCLKSE